MQQYPTLKLRPQFRVRTRQPIGLWIRCQRPLPAAIGEL